MNELALFAGAGGGILGGTLLGWRTVCAVECDAYAAGVLIARQNDGILDPFPIWDDVRTFDGRPWRGVVDVVSGGFPCQDISVAGRGEGITGERSGLWKEMARIIGEVGPRYVLVENSPALVGRGLGVVLGDLAALGYDAEWGVLGAVHAGAPHKRERIWIVANAAGHAGHQRRAEPARLIGQAGAANGGEDVANANRRLREIALRRDHEGMGWKQEQDANMATPHGGMCDGWTDEPERQEEGRTAAGGSGESLSDGIGKRLEDVQPAGAEVRPVGRSGNGSDRAWWATEPELGRVANGVAHRVDRLRAIGNGQVPAVVRLAWETLSKSGERKTT